VSTSPNEPWSGFEGFFIHCTRSNDYPWGCGNGFLFIQPFGWIRIIIAWERKSQNNPSDFNMVSTREVCGDHNEELGFKAL
jgi:hypothetical protein